MDFDFKIGDRILGDDNEEIGHLRKLVYWPQESRILGLVVEATDEVLEDHVLVPIDYIVSTTSDSITIDLAKADVHDLPIYNADEYMLVSEGEPGWDVPSSFFIGGLAIPLTDTNLMIPRESTSDLPLPEGTIELQAGTFVYCDDGPVGTISAIVTSPDGHVNGFYLKSLDDSKKGEVVVPIGMIDTRDEEGIRLKCTREEIAAMQSDPSLVAPSLGQA